MGKVRAYSKRVPRAGKRKCRRCVEVWNRERGLAWFEKPRDQDHVTRYVSEYVVKHEGGPGALCLSPNLDCARLTVCQPDQFAGERSSGVS